MLGFVSLRPVFHTWFMNCSVEITADSQSVVAHGLQRVRLAAFQLSSGEALLPVAVVWLPVVATAGTWVCQHVC